MSLECQRNRKGSVILTQEESVLQAQRTRVYSKSIWTQQLEAHWIWTQEPGCETSASCFTFQPHLPPL